jgi:hypothetical protein
MNHETVRGVHWSFRTIGAVALIWDVLGVINFFMQVNAGTLAAMPESQRAIIEGRPAWATGGFAIAVFGGALGCLLLLLRKSAAYYLFVASLLGVLVQTIPYLGRSGSTIAYGPAEISLYILMPLVLAAFLVWYSKQVKSKGWIS